MISQLIFFLLLHRGSANLSAEELRDIVEINTCGDGELCLGSNSFHRGIRCQCDPDCSMYGDCCRDSPFFRPQDISNKVCKAAYNATSNATTFISMVGTCPPDWQDPVVRNACQNRKILGEDPLASEVPMSDMSKTIPTTYRNSYCAVCNNANLSSLKIWRANLLCFKKEGQEPKGSKLELTRSDNKWSVLADGILYPCKNLTPVLAPNFEDVRRCPSRVSRNLYFNKCSDGWEDAVTAFLCKSYTAYVFQKGKAYQNSYCAQCNGVNLNGTTCYPQTLVTQTSSGYCSLNSFQELLDFELQVRCEKYEIYDPFTKRCRRMFNRTESEANAHHHPQISPKSSNYYECTKFVFMNETYILAPDNQSVWIPAHGKSYWRGEYFITDDNHLMACLRSTGITDVIAVNGILTYVGLGISIIFITLHLSAVALVAELRNLSGKTLASLCVALLCGYTSFIVGGFLAPEDVPFCTIISVAIYYFFLSAFTWMLVIGFDVWRALVQAIHFQSCRGGQWHRFFAYSAFAWLTPVIMTALAIAADNAPSDVMNEDLRPGFGVNRCWFSRGTSLMIFFGAPLTLIMILNAGFFTSAAWMTKGTRPCAMSAGVSGARRDFRLYLRLAVMVGLTWIVGLLANVLNYSGLWFAFVVLNTLQGLFIFVMFTCTAKVFRGLEKAMPWTESFRYSLSSMRGKRSTKTSSTGTSNDTLQDSAFGSGTYKNQNPELSSLYPKKQVTN